MAEADAREAAEAKAEEEAYAAAVTAAMAAMEKRRAENLEMIRGMKRKRGALAGGTLAGGAIDAAYFGISSDATAAAT
jgi:hypothetical protein